MSEAAATVDGRTARAQRTRGAIVDACVELVDEGDYRPTAPRVAARAGVSVRSVFQHFDDLEGLSAAVADRWLERIADLAFTVDPELPVAARVAEVVRKRAALLEAITPIRRAAAVHAPFSAEVRSRLQSGHDVLRHDIERFFAPELAARSASDREQLLDALDTVLSWPAWDNLRTLNRRPTEEATAVLERMVAALVST